MRFHTSISLKSLSELTRNQAKKIITATCEKFQPQVPYNCFYLTGRICLYLTGRICNDDKNYLSKLHHLKCKISFPLDKPIYFKINANEYLTIGELSWRLAKEYEKIYLANNNKSIGAKNKSKRKFIFDDLWLETIEIDENNGNVRFLIGPEKYIDSYSKIK